MKPRVTLAMQASSARQSIAPFPGKSKIRVILSLVAPLSSNAEDVSSLLISEP